MCHMTGLFVLCGSVDRVLLHFVMAYECVLEEVLIINIYCYESYLPLKHCEAFTDNTYHIRYRLFDI
jgi:hypothetical protein